MLTGAAWPRPHRDPAHHALPIAAAGQVARRALLKYIRTPSLSIMGIVQSGMFLFSFRYVFGGAIHTGSASYVDYLVPAYVATIVLFTGGGIAVAVAEDKASGFTDRLLSLPVRGCRWCRADPRRLEDQRLVDRDHRRARLRLRLPADRQRGRTRSAALGLCLVYAVVFTVVFIVMGLFAPNAQAAQGMSLIAFVFAFISSTYVPAASMPGWLQPFAKYQPITPMVDAVRVAAHRVHQRRGAGPGLVRAADRRVARR